MIPSKFTQEDDEQYINDSSTTDNKKISRSCISTIFPVSQGKNVLNNLNLEKTTHREEENIENQKYVPVFNSNGQNVETEINNNDLRYNNEKEITNKPEKWVPPLKLSLMSWTFNLYQWWYSWLFTYMVLYIGSFNLWAQSVTKDLKTVSNFAQVYGLAQLASLVLAPIPRILMDFCIKKADEETDPFERKLKRFQSCFWPISVTTLLATACLICQFFKTEIAVYISIAFMTLFRLFLMAVGTAYIRIRFF
jgi:cation transport ATPase